MAGPARAGLFVFAKDSERLSAFYEAVAGMTRIHESDDLTVLESADIQLLIHKIPDEIARNIKLSSPPEKRENTALKFFFTVEDLDATRESAKSLGGDIFHENWTGPGFIVCNGVDPEGNVFQVRENVA